MRKPARLTASFDTHKYLVVWPSRIGEGSSVAVLRNMRPRDEQGWRVPRPGTIAANIYALAKKGLITSVAKQLGRERSNITVHRVKIKRSRKGQ